MDAEAVRVWLIVAVLVGPLLALPLPHNIAKFLISCYLAGVVAMLLVGSPERPWKHG